MKDVFAARKVSKALELCIQLARIVLNLAEVQYSSIRTEVSSF